MAGNASYGSYRAWNEVPDNCVVYVRSDEAEQYVIILNFAYAERQLKLPSCCRGVIRQSTCADGHDEDVRGTLRIRRSEGVILGLAVGADQPEADGA